MAMNITPRNITEDSVNSRTWRVPGDEVLTTELVLLIVLALCILFGNGLVCIAFFTERKLQTTTNRFIVSLACSDIFVGLVTIPLYIYIKTARYVFDNFIYEFSMAMEITACSSSIASLVAISIERCLSVTMPAFHRNISHRAVHITICVAWCHSIFTSGSFMYFFAGKIRRPWMVWYRTMASFFIPLLLILVAYGIILKVAITRRRCKNPHLTKDLRVAITLALVIGAFVVAWFPVNTFSILAAFQPTAQVNWGLAQVLVKWLQYLNSIINPIIYSYCNQDFRRVFLKLLRRLKRQNSNGITDRRRVLLTRAACNKHAKEAIAASSANPNETKIIMVTSV